ncbi:GntR family transcriptional regulator [Jiella sp. M17.18]|uniref:GntR family transcriptional regulator n=1 Tax=Jiella sp. M17.18 TaxID=3234247 RepID=UPI0034DF0CCA
MKIYQASQSFPVSLQLARYVIPHATCALSGVTGRNRRVMLKRSQVHEAYLAIEDRIVVLDFRPGSMLTEKSIIETVGYGRTPVREAIQRLTMEGLTEVHPRLGVKIAEIRPEDYPRAIEPRLTLEPLLARSAARYAGPNERKVILEGMHGMRACAENGDVAGYLKQDKAIDQAISSAAANPFLPRILSPLQIHSRRFWFQYHGRDGMMESAERHAAVCQAIVAGDDERAVAESRVLMEFLFAESKAIAR